MVSVKGINEVEAREGNFVDVVPAGYILGLMDVTLGETGPNSKKPGTPQLIFHYDIVKGAAAKTYRSWSEREGQVDADGRVVQTESNGKTGYFSKYLKKYYPLNNLATLKFALAHLATQSKPQQRAIVEKMLKDENIDEAMLPKLCLSTGALLEWDKKGYIEIKNLLTVAEAEATGPTGTPRPEKKQTGGGGGEASDFGAQTFGGVEESDPFAQASGGAEEGGTTEEVFGF